MNKPEMPLLTEFPCSKCPDWVTAIECGRDEGSCERYWKWLHQKKQRNADMDWHNKQIASPEVLEETIQARINLVVEEIFSEGQEECTHTPGNYHPIPKFWCSKCIDEMRSKYLPKEAKDG